MPDALPCGRPSGAICIKIFCATTLRLIRCFHSDKLWKFPSIQLLSIDESGTILLSVWDRLETSEDDTRHVTYFCAFKNSLNLHHLENVETSSGDIQENPNGGFSKIYLIDKVLYKVSITRYELKTVSNFKRPLSILASGRNFLVVNSQFAVFNEISNRIFPVIKCFWRSLYFRRQRISALLNRTCRILFGSKMSSNFRW